MENYVCEKCNCGIQIPDLVMCPSCKKAYHRWCWKKTEKCISCEQSTQEEPINGREFLNETGDLSSYNDGMFANIGGKIEGIAKFLTAIGIILGVIICILMTSIDEDMFLIGLLIGAVIGLLSWISSFTLYGYGALISSSQNTEKLLSKLLKEIKK